MLKKQFFLFIFSLSFICIAFSQVEKPVQWNYSIEKIDETQLNLIFDAKIDEHWHLYSQYSAEGGPLPLLFTFTENKNYTLINRTTESPTPKKEYDDVFEVDIQYFTSEAKFVQKIELNNDKGFNINVVIDGQSCFDDGKCVPFTEEFILPINGGEDTKENISQIIKTTPIIVTENNFKDTQTEDNSLLVFFFISILFGFLGILTPCVFPMIPMTISFFMQDSKNSVLKAIVFGGSIMLLYTLVGVIVSLSSVGADFTTVLSSHWIPNLIFFLLFFVFAASLFGLFEFKIPTGLANKADRQVDKGGVLAAFFLGITLVIVSFACTGPIIGALLVQAASGNFLQPTVGMLGFGLGFAIPFTVLALFPKLLNKLPQSGGWMNSIKIVMGFIIIAFSLKFLSNIDQNYHLNFLSRDIYLAIWIVIFVLLGLYLLGKLKFHLDSPVEHIGFFRLLLSGTCFVFVVYLFPGLFGANLAPISGLLPPKTTQQFDLTGTSTTEKSLSDNIKYADKLHSAYNVNAYFDYMQAIEHAKVQNKPVLLYFTGHSCSNCKVMQAEIWSNPMVQDYLNTKVVVASLYVDEKTITVAEEDQFMSINDRKLKTKLGEINADIEIVNFQCNTQPFYVLMSPDGKVLTKPMSYSTDTEEFMKFLNNGITEFEK